MKSVIQRVKSTRLSVDGSLVSEIPFGLAVYLGIRVGDTAAQAEQLAKKLAALRIFEDENGKMNLSLKEVGGEILLISRFTATVLTATDPALRLPSVPNAQTSFMNTPPEFCAATAIR